MTGKKYDNDKPNMHVVLGDFANALTEVAKVGTYGINKYDKHNWLSVEDSIERYSSAKDRHYLAQFTDGVYDDESGLLHIAHEAWNALAVLELTLRRMKKDDRHNTTS